MAVSASARDRFYRTIEPLLGAEQADFLMDNLPPGGWDEIATTSDLAGVRAELREFRAEMREFRAEMREAIAQLVTRAELSEQLKLHVDASVARTNRSWLFSCMAMQAATIAGVIAAVRL